MKELNTINTLLGGHNITISGVKKILANKASNKINKPIVICEIGCGGGDNIIAINTWAKKNTIQVQFIGIDIKAACIEVAEKACKDLAAIWMVTAFEKVQFADKPDIIFSSLFCHHFYGASLTFTLHWMKNNSKMGFFINDLHRNIIAYYAIKVLTKLTSKSYLVINDAPLSVARGFKKNEWVALCHTAGVSNCTIKWKWAFRHLITFSH